MKILALKVSEVRRQQPAIAPDIPLMAQNFLGSHINRHRRRLFSEGHKEFLSGATAVVQPGGSVRDPEVIAAADEHGLAMVFTGRRDFRH